MSNHSGLNSRKSKNLGVNNEKAAKHQKANCNKCKSSADLTQNNDNSAGQKS